MESLHYDLSKSEIDKLESIIGKDKILEHKQLFEIVNNSENVDYIFTSIRSYFRPRLNEHFLLSKLSDAKLFEKCASIIINRFGDRVFEDDSDPIIYSIHALVD